ncbi:MAG: serine hydrolase [Opitutaceae bacterium]|jgi:CubicO group peptidase (beta-lactamase class C family)
MKLLSAILISTSLCACIPAQAANESSLPRSAPEAQGISSAALITLAEEASQPIYGMNSLMIVRHGQVVAEGWWAPYAASEPHVLFSLSKSFTSTAIGIAAAEGKLSIDDPVLKYFPEDAPEQPSKNLKEMRISDLLKMSTGQHSEDIDKVNYFGPEPATKQFLALPVVHKPGTLFVYNTPASYMLSAIVQKATGQSTLDYLQPRLFAPLGIEKPVWDASPQGVSLGGFGLNLRTEDIAMFGQLLLQQGEWQGKRILPAAWVELATSRQASNGSNPDSDWDQGYGFQFWRCRNGAFRGDGAFGQYCIVMPQCDTVIAITSGTKDMGAVLNLLWKRFLPELRPAALPADETSAGALKQKLAELALPPVKGAATSPIAASVSGKTFRFPENPDHIEAITVNFDSGGMKSVVRIAGKDYSVSSGMGVWNKTGELPSDTGPTPIAASGAWTSDDTYTARFCMYRTPFVLNVSLRFADGKLFLEQARNVSFGAAQDLKITGKAD